MTEKSVPVVVAGKPVEQVACTYSKKIAEPQVESIEAMRYQTKAEPLPVA